MSGNTERDRLYNELVPPLHRDDLPYPVAEAIVDQIRDLTGIENVRFAGDVELDPDRQAQLRAVTEGILKKSAESMLCGTCFECGRQLPDYPDVVGILEGAGGNLDQQCNEALEAYIALGGEVSEWAQFVPGNGAGVAPYFSWQCPDCGQDTNRVLYAMDHEQNIIRIEVPEE